MKLHITNFVRRQTKASEYSHWTLNDIDLIGAILSSLHLGKTGYREGVLLVPLRPAGFFTSIVTLKDGDELFGSFKKRKEDEEPRKQTYKFGEKTPAKHVIAVLYSHAVLVEKNEQETEADWELVSINAFPTNEEAPMGVGTLLANHFEFSGGTATKMSDAEFIAALKKSAEYWRDKALVRPFYLQCNLGDFK